MRVMRARDDDPASPLVCFCEVAARDPFFLVGKRDPSNFQLADLTRLGRYFLERFKLPADKGGEPRVTFDRDPVALL